MTDEHTPEKTPEERAREIAQVRMDDECEQLIATALRQSEHHAYNKGLEDAAKIADEDGQAVLRELIRNLKQD